MVAYYQSLSPRKVRLYTKSIFLLPLLPFFKFEIRCCYTRHFPESFPWGNSSHVLPLTICHQNGDPLSSNQAFPHPFDYIWASKHSRHPCYVVRSKKRKKNMELREGLLTGQEGGSPCQKLISLFFLYGTFKPVKCLSLLWKIKKSINHFPTILSFRLEFNSAIVLYLFVILGFHSFHCSLNKETQIVNLRTYARSHSSLYQHKLMLLGPLWLGHERIISSLTQ